MNFFQKNQHQSNGKHEKRIPFKPMNQRLNQKQDEQCDLCRKEMLKHQTKLFKPVKWKSKQQKD